MTWIQNSVLQSTAPCKNCNFIPENKNLHKKGVKRQHYEVIHSYFFPWIIKLKLKYSLIQLKAVKNHLSWLNLVNFLTYFLHFHNSKVTFITSVLWKEFFKFKIINLHLIILWISSVPDTHFPTTPKFVNTPH